MQALSLQNLPLVAGGTDALVVSEPPMSGAEFGASMASLGYSLASMYSKGELDSTFDLWQASMMGEGLGATLDNWLSDYETFRMGTIGVTAFLVGAATGIGVPESDDYYD
ncbi:hypothetical protein [Bordetella tumulicola]|uniref:hypothetical protein n=1 Tax=Bordetella tumulicola TaxID=1649133 RepID=UPI0039EF0728